MNVWTMLCYKCKKDGTETRLEKSEREMIDVECPVCGWIWKGKNPQDTGDVNESERSVSDR